MTDDGKGKVRQIRGITDEEWMRIKGLADGMEMSVGELVVQATKTVPPRPPSPAAQARKMFTCKQQGCDFKTRAPRACPRHPNAGLKEAW